MTEEDRRVLDSFKPVKKQRWWTGGRNFGRDLTGEVVPANGFTFTRELYRSETLVSGAAGYHSAFTVRAVIRLPTERTSFSLTANCNQLVATENVLYTRRRCRSITDAKLQADALIGSQNLVWTMRKKYQAQRYEVYTEDGEHLLTMFEADYFHLPEGTYIVEHTDHRVRLRRWSGGYGTEPYSGRF
jgi:hypothetical protein